MTRWILAVALALMPLALVRLNYSSGIGADISAGFVLTLALVCVLAAVPFVAAGVTIALAVRGYANSIGRVYGWVLLGVSAILANLAIAGFHYPQDYTSIGASTAIFAGVGLLTGRALGVVRGAWFVPLATGFIVLALYGSGTAAGRTDVGAHVAGFLAGLAVGFVAVRPRTALD